jgi:hypothetical protein
MDTVIYKKIKQLQLENAFLKQEMQKLQEVTKKQLKNAEDKDLKELPGKEGESAHNKLHSLLGKYLGRK